MIIPYRARPGAGFVLFLVVLAASVGLLAWAMVTPPLESFWRLQIELLAGRGRGLSAPELELMQRILAEHPSLADSLLVEDKSGLISANQDGVIDVGWAYLIRRSPTDNGLLRVLAAQPTDEPLPVKVRTLHHKAKGEAGAVLAFEWRLPDGGPFPQLIEVTVAGPGKRKGKKTSVPIMVSLGSRP
jgi:hypothetical protein